MQVYMRGSDLDYDLVAQLVEVLDWDTDLDHGLVAQLLLVSLLEVEAAVVQGLVVVLLEDLGEEGLHVLLHLAPLPVLLLQPTQHHGDGHPWVFLQQVYNLVSLLTCSKGQKQQKSESWHMLFSRSTIWCPSSPAAKAKNDTSQSPSMCC